MYACSIIVSLVSIFAFESVHLLLLLLLEAHGEDTIMPLLHSSVESYCCCRVSKRYNCFFLNRHTPFTGSSGATAATSSLLIAAISAALSAKQLQVLEPEGTIVVYPRSCTEQVLEQVLE